MIPEFRENRLARENGMSEDVTEVLAGFAASLQYDDLPGRVRDHCKNVLLDTLACAVAGHRGEETQQLAALASGLAQSNESSVIGGERLSLAGASANAARHSCADSKCCPCPRAISAFNRCSSTDSGNCPRRKKDCNASSLAALACQNIASADGAEPRAGVTNATSCPATNWHSAACA